MQPSGFAVDFSPLREYTIENTQSTTKGGEAMSENVHHNPLGTAPIPRLIARFAIPSIISMLVAAAYNITDQIFIGNIIGMYGNAATNVAFPVVTLTVAFAQITGVGTAANFNINMGAKNVEAARHYIGTGLTLMALCGAVITAIVLALKTPILWLCGATETVFDYASTYLGITAFGLPFLLVGNAMSNLIRADGSPRYAMFSSIIGAVLNIGLDALFMLVFRWGLQGAALATIVGQIISFLFSAAYFLRFKTFPITRSMLTLRGGYVPAILRLGTSSFINHIVMALVNIVLNNMLKKYGALSIYGSDIPLAVSGIAAKINSILISFGVGISHGCQPIFGFNYGAKNYDRVKKTFLTALSVSLFIGLIAFAAFQLFPRQITSVFGSGEALYYDFAEKYLRIYLMMVLVFGAQPLTLSYFTSTGNVRQGIFISLSRQGFLLIPLLVILPLFLGLNGVLCAGAIADFLACVLALSMVRRDFKRLDRLKAAAQEEE